MKTDAGDQMAFTFVTIAPPLPEGDVSARTCPLGSTDNRVDVLESKSLYVVVAPSAGSRVLRVVAKTTGRDQMLLPQSIRGGIKPFVDDPLAGEIITFTGFPGSVYNVPFSATLHSDGKSARVDMTGQVDGRSIVHSLEIDADDPGTLIEKYVITNSTATTLSTAPRTHPEFTPGGKIDFGKVEIKVPSAGAIRQTAFETYFGDRGMTAPDNGWWKARNTENGASITGAFDAQKVQGIDQWDDGKSFNMELYFRPVDLKPGESMNAAYSYTFAP
jgi:hypothetical protein